VIFDLADIIYARDQISFDYLADTFGDQTKIKRSTDFTLLVEGTKPKEDFFKTESRKACIVPNYRMIDKSDQATSKSYIQFMVDVVKSTKDFGFEPFIIIHEKGTDNELAKEINKSSGANDLIFYEDDPLKIKGKINSAELFVGSRFHGLVSALSQGIPSIGTGWSHKYKMLFEEYQCEKYLADPTISNPQKIIEEIAMDAGLELKLRKIAAQKKHEVKNMWSEIFNLVEAQS
jgi:polysaccharide pyruvyl transferase WcaK-like protein